MSAAYALADRVRDDLAANATLAGLIAGRAYLVAIDSGAASLPAVSVRIASSEQVSGGLSGGAQTATQLEVVVYSKERGQLRTMAESAETALLAISGEGSGVTVTQTPDITDRSHDFLDDAKAFAIRIQAEFNH